MAGNRLLAFWVAGLFLMAAARASAAESDPVACLQEISKVCVGQENSLETCLSDRGSRISADCRDQLKQAMAMMQDPTGPAGCVPDIERYCKDRNPQAIAACIGSQQSHFSAACQKYLQTATPKPAD